jgi:glutaredoxin-related protein
MHTTSELEFLENRIAQLDNISFAKLRDWFIEFDNARWDKQLDANSNAGNLDFLINSTLTENQTNYPDNIKNFLKLRGTLSDDKDFDQAIKELNQTWQTWKPSV